MRRLGRLFRRLTGRRPRIVARDVAFAAAGWRCGLSIREVAPGDAVVVLEGDLMGPLVPLIGRWLVPLRRAALFVTFELEGLRRCDEAGLRTLLSVGRALALAAATVRFSGLDRGAFPGILPSRLCRPAISACPAPLRAPARRRPSSGSVLRAPA